MRVSAAKSSVFSFFSVALAPAVSHGFPTHTHSTDAVARDDYVLLRQGNGGVYAEFQASCDSCSLNGQDFWPVEFFIGGVSGPCDNVTVSVNGQELSHRWEGHFASGSGSILYSPSNGSFELQANWQDICVAAPLGALHNHNAHIFTLILDHDHGQDHDHELEGDIGFTLSIGGGKEIEALRVSTFPVNLSHGSQWDDWKHPEHSMRSDRSQEDDFEDVSLEMRLEAELQKLQVLHYELRQLHKSVEAQEKKIRDLLKQDCTSLLTKWEQCHDVFCYFRSSWQKVPEFYWSIRYRFGLLGSGEINPICPPVSHVPSNDNTSSSPSFSVSTHSGHTPSVYLLHTDSESTAFSTPPSNVSPSPPTATSPLVRPTITVPPHTSGIIFDSNSDPFYKHPDPSTTEIVLPVYSPTKHFIRSCALVLLVVLIFGLFYRVVRHSTAFRRRRRDIASRREELRTRRAYRNAARRLRWRQWWEGRFYLRPHSASSNHSLAEFQHVHSVTSNGDDDDGDHNILSSHDNNDSDSDGSYLSENPHEEPESRMMQAEILGLRRVLEYVGELVGSDGSSSTRRRTRSRSRSGPPPYTAAITGNRNTVRDNNGNNSETQHSSMPRISTASAGLPSSRASTMFSLETGSLATLGTIDTLDSGTAPPSYHP